MGSFAGTNGDSTQATGISGTQDVPDTRRRSLALRHINLFSIGRESWTINREGQVLVPDHRIIEQIILEQPTWLGSPTAVIIRDKERSRSRINSNTSPSCHWQTHLLDLIKSIIHIIDI